MPYDLITNIENCYVEIPRLLYYSHIPAALMATFLGFFIYFKTRGQKLLTSKILLFISITFLFWAVLDLSLWLFMDSRKIMFSWSIINIIEMLVTVSTLYFSYLFLDKKDISFSFKLFFGILLAFFVILIPTQLNISEFNSLNCEAQQGPLVYYFYSLEIFSFLWLFVYLLRKMILSKKEERQITLLFSIGVILFLASFSGANVIGSLTGRWEILQYGLFGMPVFMAFLIYIIIKFKVFNLKLLAAQALVFGMVILIGSQFFFIRNNTNRILTAITLVLVSLFGWWLVRSVKKEVEQRENLEKLTEELKVANLRLKELDQQKTEFLSIASHQLRTPLSIMKGYLELISDGAYGKPSKELQVILKNMDESNERLVSLVDGFLDVSRIEQGRTKYSFEDCKINGLISSVVQELRLRAKDNGLEIKWRENKEVDLISLDVEKVRHVVFNFVDNAIKYTPQGDIEILLNKDTNGVEVKVIDSGLGFGEEDQFNFFQKFYRGKNVQGSNVTGTGLGLFVCRKFIESHEGRVWARSSGIGQGSEFGFWLPDKRLKNNLKDEKGMTVVNL
ncbi:MAG: PAS/PAC sensor signal transduction histidine kinase [Candidatus Magasanikbacteria bacterium GW2011_GWC2_37_14]|uniref:histidine kinase n=1 Tax=Candidatus Magasanikbacteria bacterium GW2011_GWC2_37_14 TaxID=1619046 RepID=A0A0G0GBN3_9BACT|nr:MAG: PAS/PAC sensor signal transduction histidine kinase [Candidatus Magasanikbacteria bacterium GW2011_GWC2_37_14]